VNVTLSREDLGEISVFAVLRQCVFPEFENIAVKDDQSGCTRTLPLAALSYDQFMLTGARFTDISLVLGECHDQEATVGIILLSSFFCACPPINVFNSFATSWILAAFKAIQAV
jgi:hypothetical protein